MCYAMYNGRVYFSPIYYDGGIVAVEDSFFYLLTYISDLSCVTIYGDSKCGIVS